MDNVVKDISTPDDWDPDKAKQRGRIKVQIDLKADDLPKDINLPELQIEEPKPKKRKPKAQEIDSKNKNKNALF